MPPTLGCTTSWVGPGTAPRTIAPKRLRLIVEGRMDATPAHTAASRIRGCPLVFAVVVRAGAVGHVGLCGRRGHYRWSPGSRPVRDHVGPGRDRRERGLLRCGQ